MFSKHHLILNRNLNNHYYYIIHSNITTASIITSHVFLYNISLLLSKPSVSIKCLISLKTKWKRAIHNHVHGLSLHLCVCFVIDRSWSEDASLSDSDSSPHWSQMTISQNAPVGFLTNGNGSGSSASSEPEAMVKSLIKSFDTAMPSEDTTFILTFIISLSHLHPLDHSFYHLRH